MRWFCCAWGQIGVEHVPRGKKGGKTGGGREGVWSPDGVQERWCQGSEGRRIIRQEELEAPAAETLWVIRGQPRKGSSDARGQGHGARAAHSWAVGGNHQLEDHRFRTETGKDEWQFEDLGYS